MYPVTEAFKQALTRSHQMVTRVDVVSNGQVIYEDLRITGGNVHADKTATNRRRCNIDIVDVGKLTPSRASDLLHPLSGNELQLYRGIHIARENRDELVPLGVFQIENANIEDSGESLTVGVTGVDRSKRIERRRYIEPWFVAQGTNYATAIRELINNRLPGLTYDFMTTDLTTPPMVFGTGGWSGGGSPWEDATKMATAIGAELFFNSEGTCVLRPEPDPSVDPVVWNYEEGPESTLLYVTRGLTQEDVFNHVIAYGANSATEPIRVEAMDDDPDSPTYVYGQFGDRPTFYRSTMLLTVAQAQQAADAHLRRVLGTPEQARFISVVNPAHEVGDVVTITRERAGMTETRHVLDKLTIPMNVNGSLNATCRERRVSSGS